jgi:hypothetical protein
MLSACDGDAAGYAEDRGCDFPFAKEGLESFIRRGSCIDKAARDLVFPGRFADDLARMDADA